MKTKLITREGYNKLKEELDFLWRQERPEVTRKVAWAASLGDRSENADYQYNKKRLREIDRRVRYLRKCLEELGIVDYAPAQEGKVFFGAWVEVENEEGETKRFRIVGYDEIFERKDYISIDSPWPAPCSRKRSAMKPSSVRQLVTSAGISTRSATPNSRTACHRHILSHRCNGKINALPCDFISLTGADPGAGWHPATRPHIVLTLGA